MSDKHMDAVKRARDFLEKKGFEVLFVGLYGSQNYKMDTVDSDHDFKAVVTPNFMDVVKARNPISMSLEFEDGLIDVKDVRLMVDCWKRQNQNFLEILFTKWQWVNEAYPDMAWFVEHRDAIAHMDEKRAYDTMLGMMNQKYSELFKARPAQKEDVEKYGYCGKQLSHLFRLLQFMRAYDSSSYSEALVPSADYIAFLVSVKIYAKVYSVSEAEALAEAALKQAKQFVEKKKETAKEKDEKLSSEMDYHKFKLVEMALRKELLQ